MMEIVSIIWKISYMIHMISNAGFFGSIALAFFDCKNICNSSSVKVMKKLTSLFLTLSGLTGISLLSIMAIGGMDNLTNNPIGISILIMIGAFSVVLFDFILFLLYKGGDVKVERFLLGIAVFFYLLVYVFRVYLVH